MARRIRAAESDPVDELPRKLAAFDASDWEVPETGATWEGVEQIVGPAGARKILAHDQWANARRAWCAARGLSVRALRADAT